MDPHEIAGALLETDLFKRPTFSLPRSEKAVLSFEKAKAIAAAYNFTRNDIASLSTKFWNLHLDPITCIDCAVLTFLTIQYNLMAGTLIRYQTPRDPREDLNPLIDEILRFRKNGQFLLSEVGHGLDIANIETTCTLLPSGEFSLHTPTPEAAKFMPPTVPTGLPCVAIVFARLIIDGKFRGVRPFIVDINDGVRMCKGVTSKLLPPRVGINPVNHSLTYFNKVLLPAAALLGPLGAESYTHLDTLQSIWRIAIGSMAIGSLAIPMLKVASTIGALYSARRHIGSESAGGRVPIIHFRTQQIPILTAISQAFVLEAFHGWATSQISDNNIDTRVRHGIVACFKSISVQHTLSALTQISDRCGAQGLIGVNQMATMHSEMRGVSIAEGDILVLSLRLAMELLLNRYSLPEPKDRQSILALHEIGLFERYKKISDKYHHRGDEANRLLLPHCQAYVDAIGHRMAYESAVAAGVDKDLINLYVVTVVKLDPVWYSENLKITESAQDDMQDEALSALLPRLESLVRKMDCYRYVSAPIISDTRWDELVGSLDSYEPSMGSGWMLNRGLHRL